MTQMRKRSPRKLRELQFLKMPVVRMGSLGLASRFRMWRGRVRKSMLGGLEHLAYDIAGLPMVLHVPRNLRATAPWAHYLHRHYQAHFWRQPTALPRFMLALLLWPLALVFTIIQNTWRNGAAIRLRAKLSRFRQVTGQVSAAARHAIAPPWYYMYEVFQHRTRAGEFLTAHETIAAAYERLEPKHGSDNLNDKVWFAEHFRKRRIAAVPVLFYTTGRRLEFLYRPDDPIFDTDLFVKPRIGNGGHRAERWDRAGRGKYVNSRGLMLERDALFHYLAEQSLSEDFVVQPRLDNHPALDDIANGALSTLRVLTCKNEEGRSIATNVAFRMAVGRNNVVDNFHQGGLAAPVDMATGRVGAASDIGRYPAIGWRTRHPVSGAEFEGRILPHLRQAIELACVADAAFPWRIAIGWDVALLKDGPMIIEGNGKPDLDIHQRCERRPLGRERIAELLAFHLAQRQRRRAK